MDSVFDEVLKEKPQQEVHEVLLDENGKIPGEQLDNIQINGIDLYGEDNTLADLGMQTISSAELEALWNN